MQGNGFPGSLHLLFGEVMCGEELTGGVCAIDLEAFILTGELLDQTQIVKCGVNRRLEAQHEEWLRNRSKKPGQPH
jgi:hypothetical protein